MLDSGGEASRSSGELFLVFVSDITITIPTKFSYHYDHHYHMYVYIYRYIYTYTKRERERYYCFVFSCSGEVILFEISSSTKPYPYVARACAGRLGPAVGFLEPVFFLFGFYFLGLFVNSYYGFMFLSFLFGGNPTTTYESQTTNGKFRIRVLHRLTEACGGLFGADRYILPTRLPTDEASNRVPRG